MAKKSSHIFTPGAAYFHMTSNETIGGIQWSDFPDTGDVPLVCDMSSDFVSRRIDVSKFGLIYAGAQKNAGPAGTSIVIIQTRFELLHLVSKSEHYPPSGQQSINLHV